MQGTKRMKVLLAAVFASMASTVVAPAAECPRPGTLGTSRVLRVDAAATPRVGLKQFPQTLPLDDHEVVLTFDDGPWAATTPKVLEALAAECVRATFFVVGKLAPGTSGADAQDCGRGSHGRPSHMESP